MSIFLAGADAYHRKTIQISIQGLFFVYVYVSGMHYCLVSLCYIGYSS